jgi:hypothetical protein
MLMSGRGMSGFRHACFLPGTIQQVCEIQPRCPLLELGAIQSDGLDLQHAENIVPLPI